MLNKKPLYILGGSGLVLIGLIVFYFSFWQGYRVEATLRTLAENYAKTNPIVLELYQKAHDKGAAYAHDGKITIEEYLSLGFLWKSVADQTKDMVFYTKAINTYEEAIKTYKKTNVLFYANVASIYREIKNYEMAEKRYLQALELTPGDYVLQLTLIDLYRREMNKSVAEIKARYDLASKRVLNQFPIANSFAGYLREIGEYERSLEFYKVLYESDPRLEFKRAILELEAELKKKS